jgi:protein gp37
MAENSLIQWTLHTQNWWRGCRKVHTGCENCYAENHFSCHLHGVHWGTAAQGGVRKLPSLSTWNKPFGWNDKALRTGNRARVFCMSLGDFFEEWSGDIVDHKDNVLSFDQTAQLTAKQARKAYVARPADDKQAGDRRFVPATLQQVRRDAFGVIQACTALDWLLLTKHGLWTDAHQVIRAWPHHCQACGTAQWWTKSGRCANKLCKGTITPTKLDHVWLIGSVSDQRTADRIVPQLRKIKEAGICRFVGLSCEPVVGALRLSDDWGWLSWAIVGGESIQRGKCRRLELPWLTDLLADCRRLRIPCFVKQLGSMAGESQPDGEWLRYKTQDKKGGEISEWPKAARMRQYPRRGKGTRIGS